MVSRTGVGFEFVLGPLESEIMEAAWALGRWASVGDVVEERVRRSAAAASYSTIKNVMANLYEKGHLRKRPAGKQNEQSAFQTPRWLPRRPTIEIARAVDGQHVDGKGFRRQARERSGDRTGVAMRMAPLDSSVWNDVPTMSVARLAAAEHRKGHRPWRRLRVHSQRRTCDL